MEKTRRINSPGEAVKCLSKKGLGYNISCYEPEEFPGIFFCVQTILESDPVLVFSYIVTADGEIYHQAGSLLGDGRGFDKALEKIKALGIFPRSAEEALRMATKLVNIWEPDDLVILDGSEAERLRKLSPGAAGPDPAAPHVTEKEGYYEVVVYTLTQLPPSFFSAVPEVVDGEPEVPRDYFNRYVVRLGKGVCELVEE